MVRPFKVEKEFLRETGASQSGLVCLAPAEDWSAAILKSIIFFLSTAPFVSLSATGLLLNVEADSNLSFRCHIRPVIDDMKIRHSLGSFSLTLALLQPQPTLV
jgi:hypothetical protein